MPCLSAADFRGKPLLTIIAAGRRAKLLATGFVSEGVDHISVRLSGFPAHKVTTASKFGVLGNCSGAPAR